MLQSCSQCRTLCWLRSKLCKDCIFEISKPLKTVFWAEMGLQRRAPKRVWMLEKVKLYKFWRGIKQTYILFLVLIEKEYPINSWELILPERGVLIVETDTQQGWGPWYSGREHGQSTDLVFPLICKLLDNASRSVDIRMECCCRKWAVCALRC